MGNVTIVLSPDALDARAAHVLLRLERGETVQDLADEYRVNRISIWRWKNHALRNLLPEPEEREQWRQEILATYADRIANAGATGDDKALVALTKGLREMLGLDHSDKLREAQARIEAERVRLVARALDAALNAAGVAGTVRETILETLVAEIERTETTD